MTDNETCLPASSSSIMVEVPVDKCTADKLEKFHEEISIILSLSLSLSKSKNAVPLVVPHHIPLLANTEKLTSHTQSL